MKYFSPDLMNLLSSGLPLYRVDLFKIGPCKNGSMIYATNGGYKVNYNGNTYYPVLYGSWERDTVTTKIGLESNGCTLTVKADNQVPVYFPGTSQTVLLMDGIKFGFLDAQLGPAGGGSGVGGAPVTIYTAYMPQGQWGTVVGPNGGSLVETKFVGIVTTINRVGITLAEVAVQDMMYLLNLQIPRRILQPSCDWVLYGVGCTLTASTFSRTDSVGTLLNNYSFNPNTNLTTVSPAGTFTQGYLVWTTGKNNGLANFIRQWTPGGIGLDVIQLDIAPVFPISVTDAFTIYEGCNKTFTSCVNLQGSTNAPKNYGGAPTVPVPETAL